MTDVLTLYSSDPNVVGTYGAVVIVHDIMTFSKAYEEGLYFEVEKTLRSKIQSEMDSQYEDSYIVVPCLISHIDRYIDSDLDRVIFTAKVKLVWFQSNIFKL